MGFVHLAYGVSGPLFCIITKGVDLWKDRGLMERKKEVFGMEVGYTPPRSLARYTAVIARLVFWLYGESTEPLLSRTTLPAFLFLCLWLFCSDVCP